MQCNITEEHSNQINTLFDVNDALLNTNQPTKKHLMIFTAHFSSRSLICVTDSAFWLRSWAYSLISFYVRSYLECVLCHYLQYNIWGQE